MSALPRTVHPGAWWLWALGMAVAAGRTANPVLLVLILAVTGFVVAQRRGDAPWALAFRMYLILGGYIVAMRVLFRIVFGGGQGDTVLFTLPQIPLPQWAAGIRLFGPVAAEQLLGGLYDGLRLATVVVCVGAANALANPKRMLKALPGALYEIGTSVVVTLTVASQLAESVQRVRRARMLRGGTTFGAVGGTAGGPRKGRTAGGLRKGRTALRSRTPRTATPRTARARRRNIGALRGIVVPVLEDAMNRSLALAAAMASHGYGRTGGRATPRARLLTGTLVIAGLLGVCAGLYGATGASTPPYLGTPLLLGGLSLAGCGFVLGGRRVRRSVYRPDPWRGAEWLVAASGVVAAALMYAASRTDAASLYPRSPPSPGPR
ncbi:energy-coupling factor transporter transmembrane protein EcfT [Streptomyces sp. MST-110588]|uniref:energy-coupling factor transporter transmembrane protein EcfT n=1 Tax=Streptomyces sp. MST-110588 TaxID=2833628 RepID=UPI001F5C8B06|nr:energy-coupling factor transporter transmembrane protein EcfT [Streptomyces sp. MST-110588]